MLLSRDLHDFTTCARLFYSISSPPLCIAMLCSPHCILLTSSIHWNKAGRTSLCTVTRSPRARLRFIPRLGVEAVHDVIDSMSSQPPAVTSLIHIHCLHHSSMRLFLPFPPCPTIQTNCRMAGSCALILLTTTPSGLMRRPALPGQSGHIHTKTNNF